MATAANKLKLKRSAVATAKLFVWRTGLELPTTGILEECEVRNDDIIAVSLGEPYAGPHKLANDGSGASRASAEQEIEPVSLVHPPHITGSDDAGRTYDSLEQLWADQAKYHEVYSAANAAWWEDDGYGGATDEEAMIGDAGSDEDVMHSLAFLDGVRGRFPALQLRSALDAGAGVGRVTKHVLLRRCESVCLLEASERWLKQARRYVGNKRAQRCSFVLSRLEALQPGAAPLLAASHDLIWVQWTLQYLVDAHVVAALTALRTALTASGILIVKENRPCPATGSGATAEDCVRVDLPSGPHGRYDVTRPDEHHLWLFRCAGLQVLHSEVCVNGEATAWALQDASRASHPASRILIHANTTRPAGEAGTVNGQVSRGDANDAGSYYRTAPPLAPVLLPELQTAEPPLTGFVGPTGPGGHLPFEVQVERLCLD